MASACEDGPRLRSHGDLRHEAPFFVAQSSGVIHQRYTAYVWLFAVRRSQDNPGSRPVFSSRAVIRSDAPEAMHFAESCGVTAQSPRSHPKSWPRGSTWWLPRSAS